ncbi:hypothetical protein PYW07_009253 [Mythimna separata]|uniref:Uncharacterized protein n=1 Tax=Mythimna separata TaxID=271217 RepID=A0AAD7YB94_MYTSE|nr:hypothetical protein PYW07_009253 [Mythimna separata]
MHKNTHLSERIAQEAQLLAEEKWIIDTLKKLKKQKNCLQIERLHLENLRTQLRSKYKLRKQLLLAKAAMNVVPEPSSQASAPQVPTQVAQAPRPAPEPEEPTVVTTLSQFDVPVAGIDDEMCNNVTLDLSVTDSVFTNQKLRTLDMEEDEEDLDNDLGEEEDMENTLIDMNMLMQAQPRN